jgi:hypothetical protein
LAGKRLAELKFVWKKIGQKKNIGVACDQKKKTV